MSDSQRIDNYVPDGVYVILLGDGDEWWAQCGGYACNHRSTNGEIIKVSDEDSALMDYFTSGQWCGWCDSGIDEATAEFVERTIPVFSVDRARMAESCEAWIVGSYSGSPAILTWPNSD